MKIGLDLQATRGRATGLGIYAENLAKSLADEARNGTQLYFYRRRELEDLNTVQRWHWENVALPRMAKRDQLDILHVPGFAPPLFKAFKVVVTVHDLIGMILPNQLGGPSRFYWGTWLPWRVKKADAIIADSENTRRDIVRLLGIGGGKIQVIYPSGHERFSPVKDLKALEEIKARIGIQEKYFLFVGTIEPRKNLVRVVEAFGRFLRQKKREVRYQLVVVGSKEFAHGGFFKSVVSRCVDDSENILCTGYLQHEDLHHLYAGAQAFLYPSLYEGFGIPVLEAMACGTPVLTSNLSSLPEVAGDAALFVDPYNTEEILEGLRTLADDSGVRGHLVAKGLERIKRFSWRETARQTFAVYESLS